MVRQATLEDLHDVAKIHMECFSGTVTARLGKLWNGKIVVDYYKEYFNDCPELFLVAENDSGKVVGFCMGYKLEDEGKSDKRLIKHHLLSILIGFIYLLMKGDKECWRKLKSFYKKGKIPDNKISIIDSIIYNIPATEKAELFTIGLFEDFRGLAYGKELILDYFEACKLVGRKVCLISYINENTRAERFYYKHGCKPYLENGNNNKICYKLL